MAQKLLSELRAQPFYRGQVLHVAEFLGRPAESMPVDDNTLKSFPRLENGSLPLLLRALGYDSVYANVLAGLGQAFGPDGDCDTILVADYSLQRELFWQLAALIETLDEGRVCPILCRDEDAAIRAEECLKKVAKRADIDYACSILRLKREVAASVLVQDFPLLQIYTPETLRMLMRGEFGINFVDQVLPAVRRVVIPNLAAWSVCSASHTAWLLRELQIEASRHGATLALAATTSPAANTQGFVDAFWGKPVKQSAYLESDSVESPPATFAFYGGALVRDPDSGNDRWVRQELGEEAKGLLRWLAGPIVGTEFTGAELHYIVDVSASMDATIEVKNQGALTALVTDLQQRVAQVGSKELDQHAQLKALAYRLKHNKPCRLDAVMSAVLRDFERRREQGKLRSVQAVKLTAFSTEATEEFSWSGVGGAENALSGLQKTVLGLKVRGGTNLPIGLGQAMHSALAERTSSVEFILFSDGESCILPGHRKHLLNITREARGAGRHLGLVYVILDMSPPQHVCNLILELGGRIVATTSQDLVSLTDLEPEPEKEEVVIFYSAEGGLPESVANVAKTGRRRLQCIRHLSALDCDPKQVIAVVVSGNFSDLGDIARRVRHLGKYELTVFVLVEADPRTQVLIRDYRPNGKQVRPCLLIAPENPVLARTRLADFSGGKGIEPSVVRYLLGGSENFAQMRASLRKPLETGDNERDDDIASQLPADFELDHFGDHPLVVLKLEARAGVATEGKLFSAFSGKPTEQVRVYGAFEARWDAATVGVNLIKGRRLALESGNYQVEDVTEEGVKLTAATLRSAQPIIGDFHVAPTTPDTFDASETTIAGLGGLAHGRVCFDATVTGRRICERGKLDEPGSILSEMFATPLSVQLQTQALRWRVENKQCRSLSGLVSLLNISLPSIFPHFDETLMVVPVPNGSQLILWLVDLAPGGNGASRFLFEDKDAFLNAIRLGGLVALECPCEGGFAATSVQMNITPEKLAADPGCPRCTLAFVPLLANKGGTEFTATGSKKDTLDWLLYANLLPSTGGKHIEEKYVGTDDLQRISGPDLGSRRGALPLCRRILHDRLGFTLEDEKTAVCGWLNEAKAEILGCYDPKSNELRVRKGTHEWQILDVTAHEFFHNLQHRGLGLFEHSKLGPGANPKPAFDGLLFIEGSAVWAESHVMDALAVRTALDSANLRQGDEYAAGFQLFKWIEENHGVAAVIAFLATGDIGSATAGKVSTLEALYQQANVFARLRAYTAATRGTP